jgi:hypothetical protein
MCGGGGGGGGSDGSVDGETFVFYVYLGSGD